MDLTPQRGAFSRVLNRLARNTKIVFSHGAVGLVGLFVCTILLLERPGESHTALDGKKNVCTIILQIPFVCVTGTALENPVRPSKRLKHFFFLECGQCRTMARSLHEHKQ